MGDVGSELLCLSLHCIVTDGYLAHGILDLLNHLLELVQLGLRIQLVDFLIELILVYFGLQVDLHMTHLITQLLQIDELCEMCSDTARSCLIVIAVPSSRFSVSRTTPRLLLFYFHPLNNHWQLRSLSGLRLTPLFHSSFGIRIRSQQLLSYRFGFLLFFLGRVFLIQRLRLHL